MSRRPVHRKRTMGGSPASSGGIAGLDIKVGILENDISDVSTRLDNLDTKFDRVMGSFATEFRTAIAALSTQLGERNKTPWGILISGAGVLLTIVALVGHQALSPIADNLNRLTDETVPRKEFDSTVYELRQSDKELRQRDTQQLLNTIENLRKENNLLRYKGSCPAADHP